MHIPDGSIGPQTYVTAYAAVAPFWIAASRKLNRSLHSKQVPLMALSAAFCFVIMMFNIPTPFGPGHAVGAVLVAVLLGPWAACIAVSIAVIVQAVVFSDGGITCVGANCLNMAVIMPFVGYGVYRLVAGRSDATSRRRWVGAALGGYVGLNAAALAAAVMFGLQPMIGGHDAAGLPLYAPYSLKAALAGIGLGHIFVFGPVEAVMTGLVVRYIQKADPALIHSAANGASEQ